MPKFSKYVDTPKDGEFIYKTKGGGDYRTTLPLSQRSFKNQPKYSDGKSRVRFQDWLHIKGEGGRNPSDCKKGQSPIHASHGKSAADGKWYGWSHRAVYGFGVGDKVKGASAGKKVEYPQLPDGGKDFDNGKYEPDFTIKTDAQAREVALTFADSVS